MISMHAHDLPHLRSPLSRPLVTALVLMLAIALTLVAIPARPANADHLVFQFVAVPTRADDGTVFGQSFRSVVTGAPAGDPLTFDSKCDHRGLAAAVSFRDAAAVLLFASQPPYQREPRAVPITVYWERAAFPPGTRFFSDGRFGHCLVDGIWYEIGLARAGHHH